MLSVDDSSLPLPNTPELKKEYGCCSSGKGEHTATCRVSILYDVLNEIVIKDSLYSYHSSEQEACVDLLQSQDLRDKLLLLDRGYPSFWMYYLLLERKTHFVFRASSGSGKEFEKFLESEQTDKEVTLYPSYKSTKRLKQMGRAVSKNTAVKVRLVKVHLDTQETELLVTNLYDKEVYPIDIFKPLYHLRWNTQTCYGYLKEQLELQQFSGISQVCIEQDFAATLFLYNLQSLIQKQTEPFVKAVSAKRKYNYKVNKNITWGLLKHTVVKLFLEDQEARSHILSRLDKQFSRFLEPVRPHRKYPRIKKPGPMGKFYTLNNYKRAL